MSSQNPNFIQMKTRNPLYICALIVVLTLVSNNLFGLDTPNFLADKTEGCSPSIVRFTNLTDNLDSYTYVWDFGNGNSSSSQNPTTTYNIPGFYSVTLTVFDGTESSSITFDNYINIYSPPSVTFTPDILVSDCIPSDVNFESNVMPSDRDYTFLWDFGDGSQSDVPDVLHSYTFAGTYNVTLIVEDENGCSGRITKENLIVAQKPEVFFKASDTRSCAGQLEVNFSNLSYGNSELDYHWDFGDGNISTDKNPNYLYEDDGVFDVLLKVTDNLGCTDSVTFSDYITIDNTIASFIIPDDTICLGSTLQFTNASENNRKNYWDFGDGNVSTVPNPSHKFNDVGDYWVELKVENYECSHTYKKKIRVEEIEVDFTSSLDFSCQVPFNVEYNVIGENIVNYDWRFGNGKSSSLKTPTISFESNEELAENYFAEYSDTLIVTNIHGCTKKTVKQKNITIALPKVIIVSDGSTQGCVPLSVELSSEIDYPNEADNIVGYQWILDGNDVSTEETFSNTFDNTGIHSMSLKVETSLGCTAEGATSIAIGQKLDPVFSVKDKSVFCASEYVEFIDETDLQGLRVSKNWDYGDGEGDPFGIAVHQYVDTGYMNVGLNLYNNGCRSSVTKNNLVYIKGPIASLQRVDMCDDPNTANVQLNLLNSDNYTFDFGDGTIVTDEGELISHTYSNKGEYDVKLTATKSGCSSIYGTTLYITKAQALFDTISEAPCLNKIVTFDPGVSIDASNFVYNHEFKKYLWDFGDGSPLEFTDSPVNHAYKVKGDFVATLVIQDINHCADTIKKSINIYHPNIDFSSDYVNGCLPVIFQFTDNTESQVPIDSWTWDFGDGTNSNLQNPDHSYLSFGNYDVELSVVNSKGCIASKKLNQEIQVVKPDAIFSVSDPTTCIKDTIEFFDKSLSNIESHYWDFGDGNTSTDRIPEHAYLVSGDYDVSLKIIDDHGCEKTSSKSAYVNVQQPPVAQFSSPVTESNCYPFSIQYFNETVDNVVGSQKWIFGDNLTGSNLKNPKHIYTKPDEYDISLIAYSSNGCPDTLTKVDYVQIRGAYAEVNLVDTACIYNDIEFSLKNIKNISSVIWDFGDGYTSENLTANHTYDKKGVIYPLVILNSDGTFNCSKGVSDTIYVDRITSDFNFADNIQEGCVPLSLNTTNSSSFASNYVWKIGQTEVSTEASPNLLFSDAGNHDVDLVVNDAFGCYDTISRVVTALPLPVITTSTDTFICKGDNVLIWALGGIEYLWDNASSLDNASIENPIASPDKTTVFKVSVTDHNSCVNTDSINLTVQQPPVIKLNDSTIIIGESIHLNIEDEGLHQYSWIDSPYLSCNKCPNPTLAPLEDTRFVISVSDTSDCFTEEFDTYITVLKKYSVSVPEAFTPNDDEINDIIFVKGWGIEKLVYLRVFNRLGQLMFESNDIKIGWDGSFKGKPQNPDVYNYVVKVRTFENQFLEKKGSIKLIR